MAKIEFRTTHGGETAQLLINGVDVSKDAYAVEITFDPVRKGRVLVEYRDDDIFVEGDFAEAEPGPF